MEQIKKPKVAIFIGRFSTPHVSHIEVMKRALELYDGLIVVIGSADQARNIKNPFTFAERKSIIEDCLLNTGRTNFSITKVQDYPYNDTTWSTEVTIAVNTEIQKQFGNTEVEVFITGSDRDSSTWYLHAFPQWKQDLISAFGRNINATAIRHWLFSEFRGPRSIDVSPHFENLPVETLNFLKQYVQTDEYHDMLAEYKFIMDYKKLWEVAPYPVTIDTADAVIIQSGHVLVIERDNYPGKGLVAIPGGHLEQGETFQDCAIREGIEETAISFTTGKKSDKIARDILKMSVKASKVFDYPERSLKGRVISVAFLFALDDNKALPEVKPQVGEVKRVFWMPLAEAVSKPEIWFEDHYHILQWAITQKGVQ